MNPGLFESQFVAYLSRLHGKLEVDVREVLLGLCRATQQQHSSLDLKSYSAEFIDRLKALPFVGEPADDQPLVISGNKLFLQRFYFLEKEVAEMIVARNQPAPVIDNQQLADALSDAFGNSAADQQKLAVLQGVLRQLAIITGGPGTGKTSIVLKLINVLVRLIPELNIQLAAPTGKAAMRLVESLQQSYDARSETEQPGVIPDFPVRTLHRLLGVRRDGRSFRHNAQNPIVADLLIVDEASMIDLPMMHRLLSALPRETRLILIGDPDQLPSVDTGNVLADLCSLPVNYGDTFAQQVAAFGCGIESGQVEHRLTDAVCKLDKSYRFDSDSAIGKLSADIRLGIATLEASKDKAITILPEMSEQNLPGIFPGYWQRYVDLLASGCIDPHLLLAAFNENRILCSHRNGFPGVLAINRAIEGILETRGLKVPSDAYYHGRPVMITRNDYNLRLFNGDIGICIKGENLRVFFPSSIDQSEGYLASRLPEHETCFAMTVHKSQGSEFNHVTLLLTESDEDSETRVNETLVTRQLIYTAVTRARQTIALNTTPHQFQRIMQRSSARTSGIPDFLSSGGHT